mgnify:CR=1 FL=1
MKREIKNVALQNAYNVHFIGDETYRCTCLDMPEAHCEAGDPIRALAMAIKIVASLTDERKALKIIEEKECPECHSLSCGDGFCDEWLRDA